VTPTEDDSPRPALIADTAVSLIARAGLRALTHRAVDRAANLPQGSTSYYAPTRAALLELVAARLAERSIADLDAMFASLDAAQPTAETDGPERVAELLAGFAERLAARPDDMRARYALLLDPVDGAPLREFLATRSPVLTAGVARGAQELARLGVAVTPAQMQELVGLVDGLVFAHTVREDAPGFEPRTALRTYLRGLTG